MGLFLTDPKSIRQREYVNIPSWQGAGYTGKGITIFHDDVDDNSHSGACADIIETILPEAKVLRGRISYTSKYGEIDYCQIYCFDTGEELRFDDFIKKNNVSQINNSTTGGRNTNDSPIAKYLAERIEKFNLFCTGGAGNHSDMSNKYQGAFIMVSGVYFFKDSNKIMKYGASGEAVDFSSFMGFQMGTSFSAPFLNAMGGLYRSKYGRITQDQIYQLFKRNSKHLGAIGKNEEFGWGLPLMEDVNKSSIE